MVTKKLFALASVTALTGLMSTVAASGCSSTKTETAADTDATTPVDAGKTDAKKPPVDDEDSSTSNTCPTKDAIDATKLPWKAPYVEKGACSDAELAALVKFVDENDTAKYADWKSSVANAGCKACIFGKEADTAWRPLLENAKGELVGLNVGGCIAVAANGGGPVTAGDKGDKCGQSYQNWFDCRFEACAECPDGDTAALQKCLSAASKGACKKAFDDVGTICGDQEISDAETACNGDKFVFEGPIKGQCIGLAEGGE